MYFYKPFSAVLAGVSLASAITLNVEDAASIKTAASTIVNDMLKTWYTGNTSSTASDYGLLPKPYYWWEAGAMWGGLVDYSHYTGDSSFDETIAKAIVSQASSTTDFMMVDTQAFDLGNDDMLFWTLTAMNAAEYNFHVPTGQPEDIYFQLAKNVFNLMTTRWNTTTCDGGIKWQFLPDNNGFYYKSTITNSAFFQVAARLGRMTGNQTYIDWANRAYDWMQSIHYIDSNYFVYDGAGDAGSDNCKTVDSHQWSYNIASTLAGAAYMYSATGSDLWKNRTLGHLNAVKINFITPFSNSTNILYERECEAATCNTDQLSFKAYLAQCLGKASIVFPEIVPDVTTILKTSASAAAKTCTSGSTGRFCGTKWFIGGSDGTEGVGQQMTAFETIQSLLVWKASGPVKRADGSSPSPAPSATSTSTSATATATTAGSSTTTNAVPATTGAVTSGQKPNKENVGFLATSGAPLQNCACIAAN